MGKAFTDEEKTVIQERLLRAGRERFARYGIRKTNVEELARSAGISKGAFYAFYNSKEALYIDIMEQVEAEMQAELLEEVRRSGEPTKEGFKCFLLASLDLLKAHPFFAGSSRDDLQYLLLKLPAEKVEAGIRNDIAFVGQLLQEWEEKGLKLRQGAEMVSSVVRALVLVSLQQDEFDPRLYPAMMELFADAIAGELVNGGRE